MMTKKSFYELLKEISKGKFEHVFENDEFDSKRLPLNNCISVLTDDFIKSSIHNNIIRLNLDF